MCLVAASFQLIHSEGADTFVALKKRTSSVRCAHLSVCLDVPSVRLSSFQVPRSRFQGEYVKFMPRHPASPRRRRRLVAARLIVAYACCLFLFLFPIPILPLWWQLV